MLRRRFQGLPCTSAPGLRGMSWMFRPESYLSSWIWAQVVVEEASGTPARYEDMQLESAAATAAKPSVASQLTT